MNNVTLSLHGSNLLLKQKSVVLLGNGRRFLLVRILGREIKDVLTVKRMSAAHSLQLCRGLHSLIGRVHRISDNSIRYTQKRGRVRNIMVSYQVTDHSRALLRGLLVLLLLELNSC